MLLSQLIAQQQFTYAQIQVQIEALQEQQRQIQAHLQRLGSVESQMVSARQVIQEAIASINEVCPDELAGYKDLICGLFNKPSAAITAGNDDQPEPTPPGGEEPVPVAEESKAVEVSCEVIDLLPRIKSTIASMSYAQIKEVLSSYDLDTKGKQMMLKERFINHCETMSEVELEAVWEYLNVSYPQAA